MEVGEINAARLLWLCGWDEILVPGADGFGVKEWEEEKRQYLKKSWPGGPIIVFKIIIELLLNTSVCCLKTGQRWFQNYHFKYGCLNNVFQTTWTLNKNGPPNAFFYFYFYFSVQCLSTKKQDYVLKWVTKRPLNCQLAGKFAFLHILSACLSTGLYSVYCLAKKIKQFLHQFFWIIWQVQQQKRENLNPKMSL